MYVIILVVVIFLLIRALPTILDIISARMQVKTARLQRETEMIKRQTEQIKAAKTNASIKLSSPSLAACGCIAPWQIEEEKKNLVAAGMQPENADAFLDDLIKKQNLDIDYGYERYTLSVIMKKEAFQHALIESLKDAFKRGVSREARIAFWLRCNPGKTEQDAQVAVFASEMIND